MPVLLQLPTGRFIATYKDLLSKYILIYYIYIYVTNINVYGSNYLNRLSHRRMYNEARKPTGGIRLSDFFQKIDIVQSKDNYDSFYRGLLTQKAQEQDEFITKEVCFIL